MVAKFSGKRGHVRVHRGRYRLQHRGDTKLINPQDRPEFARLFAPGKYVVMKMHFDSNEVALGCCPKCLTEQETSLNAQTQCAICDFTYTTEDEIVLASLRQVLVTRPNPIFSTFGEFVTETKTTIDEDRPEHFKNVSIGAIRPDPALPRRVAIPKLAVRPFRRRSAVSKPFQCKDQRCQKSFRREADLKRHWVTVHEEPVELFSCEQCGYSTGRHDKILEHLKGPRHFAKAEAKNAALG